MYLRIVIKSWLLKVFLNTLQVCCSCVADVCIRRLQPGIVYRNSNEDKYLCTNGEMHGSEGTFPRNILPTITNTSYQAVTKHEGMMIWYNTIQYHNS